MKCCGDHLPIPVESLSYNAFVTIIFIVDKDNVPTYWDVMYRALLLLHAVLTSSC